VPRSHPPTLLTLAARTLREECGVARGARILVAVSGGPDSTALLDVLARLSENHGMTLVAHGVDHGLREEAAAELELARRHAERLGVEFGVTKLRLEPGGNLQARARAARYAALEEMAKKRDLELIATAHHADDRAETVLLRLLRGSGPRGLGVLRAREGQRIRPLIRARRSDVLAHCARHGVPFATDPSNLDRRFLRARVRAEVLPLLSELSPGVVAHLNALADALSEEDLPRDWREAAERADVELGRAHWRALARARNLGLSSARVRLPGGKEAQVDEKTGELRIEFAGRSDRR
jgi:tRNA(Ile)-lysidine synthase